MTKIDITKPLELSDGWEPMETAPLNGTEVTLRYKHVGMGKIVEQRFAWRRGWLWNRYTDDWFCDKGVPFGNPIAWRY